MYILRKYKVFIKVIFLPNLFKILLSYSFKYINFVYCFVLDKMLKGIKVVFDSITECFFRAQGP